jgi:hypothetical protein
VVLGTVFFTLVFVRCHKLLGRVLRLFGLGHLFVCESARVL